MKQFTPSKDEASDDRIETWLEGAVFINDGKPQWWFHGTDVADPFNIFTEWQGETSIGFHFGTANAANARIEQIFRMARPEDNEGHILPVLCRAQKPLRLPDLMCWDQWSVITTLLDAGIIHSDDEAESVMDRLETETLFAAIELAGYDCVVYTNACEDLTSGADSLLIWRSELLKSPFASSFDPNDPRLLPQNLTTAEDMNAWVSLTDRIEHEKQWLRSHRSAL